VTRKLWMTLGTLTLLLAAGTAMGDEQNCLKNQGREEGRKQLARWRKACRQEGMSPREAKARAWRQIALARAAAASANCQASLSEMASEVLVIAAELSQSGSHKAAM